MKTEFTNEEMYDAYAEAVADALVDIFHRRESEVPALFERERFRHKFLHNPADYELLEPETLARIFHERQE